MLLLVTIPIALFFHPSEEFIKQLGSNSPESVSKTQGLKKFGVYTKQWLSCTNTNAFVSFNTHTILYTLNLIVSLIIPGILFGFSSILILTKV